MTRGAAANLYILLQTAKYDKMDAEGVAALMPLMFALKKIHADVDAYRKDVVERYSKDFAGWDRLTELSGKAERTEEENAEMMKLNEEFNALALPALEKYGEEDAENVPKLTDKQAAALISSNNWPMLTAMAVKENVA